jgi:hypothetical protein
MILIALYFRKTPEKDVIFGTFIIIIIIFIIIIIITIIPTLGKCYLLQVSKNLKYNLATCIDHISTF